MKQVILKDIIKILEEKNLAPKSQIPEIDKDTVVKSLGLDSLDTVELIMDIEEKYDIRVSGLDIKETSTLGSLAEEVEHILKSKKV